MKIKQISIVLDNKPARLIGPCSCLARAGINIVTGYLADSRQFGILRLVIREWEQAKQVLESNGCVVTVTEVVAIEVPDRPGGLLSLLEVTERARLNIEYMYAFTYRGEDKAVMIFRFESPDAALKTLQAAGINALSEAQLFSRIKK